MEGAKFTLSYNGPALENHEMNVKDIAPALLALGELLEEANNLLNDGNKVKVAVNIKATTPGSINIDFTAVQSLLDQAKDLFNGTGVTAIVNAVTLLQLLGIGDKNKGVINILSWIKGRKIKSITKAKIGEFRIELEEGSEMRIFSEKEINLFSSLKIRKSLEAIIKKPLESNGVNEVSFNKGSLNGEVTITGEDKDMFASPDVAQEIIGDEEIEVSLQVIDVSFRDGGKWKFSDGNSVFFADVKDIDYLNKITNHEIAFAKDDVLKVIAHRKQYLFEGGIKTEYEIKRILNHRSAIVNLKLPFKFETD